MPILEDHEREWRERAQRRKPGSDDRLIGLFLREEIRRLRRRLHLGQPRDVIRAQTRERVRCFRRRQAQLAAAVLALALLHDPARAQSIDQERATARASEQDGAALGLRHARPQTRRPVCLRRWRTRSAICLLRGFFLSSCNAGAGFAIPRQ